MWIAQEAAPSPIEFVNFGVLGLVVVAFVAGWLWPKPPVDRLIQDKDRLIEERTKQLEALIGEVHALRSEVQDMRGEMRELTRRVRGDP